MRSRFGVACALCGLLFSVEGQAADRFGPFEIRESHPRTELWLMTGFKTWHFNNDVGLNGNNPGWGLDYRYSTTVSITAGRFFNSDRQDSRYLGFTWLPLNIKAFRFGTYAGLFDGYPRMMNGGAFAALVPVISAEYGRVGANIIVVPSIQDRLYGGISLQLKLKVY